MGKINKLLWPFRWFKFFLSSDGISIDPRSYISPSTILNGYNKVSGKSSILNSSIGRYSYVVNSRICNTSIGKFCSIAGNTVIGGIGNHPTKFISTHPIFYSTLSQCGKTFTDKNKFKETSNTTIGHDVWIGHSAIIIDNITVGTGAIIASGAVVVRDVPPYAIVGGVPARVIKYRFSPHIINLLLLSEWWDYPEDKLKRLLPIFQSENEEDFNKIRSE